MITRTIIVMLFMLFLSDTVAAADESGLTPVVTKNNIIYDDAGKPVARIFQNPDSGEFLFLPVSVRGNKPETEMRMYSDSDTTLACNVIISAPSAERITIREEALLGSSGIRYERKGSFVSPCKGGSIIIKNQAVRWENFDGETAA